MANGLNLGQTRIFHKNESIDKQLFFHQVGILKGVWYLALFRKV